eukprot:1765774-Karenia_brevis.AAC.1
MAPSYYLFHERNIVILCKAPTSRPDLKVVYRDMQDLYKSTIFRYTMPETPDPRTNEPMQNKIIGRTEFNFCVFVVKRDALH